MGIEEIRQKDRETEEISYRDTVDTALEKTPDDPGAPLEEDVIEALRYFYENDMATYVRYKAKFKKANNFVSLQLLDQHMSGHGKPHYSGEDGGDDRTKVADELVELGKEHATFFHDPNQQCYASFERDGHTETWRLRSEGFLEWLSYAYYQETKKTPRDASLKDAINTLSGFAKYEGDEIEVHLMKFWRTNTMQSLPTPTETGNVVLLWLYINVPAPDRDFILAWIFECWRTNTPFLILENIGEQGTAKSTSQDFLKLLIDPNQSNLRTKPKNIEDVYVSARNNWLVSFNNLSHLSKPLQDALCTLATGGGFATRTLYTNLDETVCDVSRPVVMNGINALATEGDLIDRVIRIEPTLIESNTELTKLYMDFERDKPAIFGALLNLFVKSLSILPSVELIHRPRLVDFARLGEAVFQARGHAPGCFSTRYREKRARGFLHVVESSPVAQALVNYIEKNETYENGPVNLLFQHLGIYRHDDAPWPKSARGFADKLRRCATALRHQGINVVFDPVRHNDGIYVSVTFTHPESGNKKTEKQCSRHTQITESDHEHREGRESENIKKNKPVAGNSADGNREIRVV